MNILPIAITVLLLSFIGYFSLKNGHESVLHANDTASYTDLMKLNSALDMYKVHHDLDTQVTKEDIVSFLRFDDLIDLEGIDMDSLKTEGIGNDIAFIEYKGQRINKQNSQNGGHQSYQHEGLQVSHNSYNSLDGNGLELGQEYYTQSDQPFHSEALNNAQQIADLISRRRGEAKAKCVFFETLGSYVWKVPTGVNAITVEAVGSGGIGHYHEEIKNKIITPPYTFNPNNFSWASQSTVGHITKVNYNTVNLQFDGACRLYFQIKRVKKSCTLRLILDGHYYSIPQIPMHAGGTVHQNQGHSSFRACQKGHLGNNFYVCKTHHYRNLGQIANYAYNDYNQDLCNCHGCDSFEIDVNAQGAHTLSLILENISPGDLFVIPTFTYLQKNYPSPPQPYTVSETISSKKQGGNGGYSKKTVQVASGNTVHVNIVPEKTSIQINEYQIHAFSGQNATNAAHGSNGSSNGGDINLNGDQRPSIPSSLIKNSGNAYIAGMGGSPTNNTDTKQGTTGIVRITYVKST